MLLTERIPTSDPVPATEDVQPTNRVDVTVVLPCYNEQDHVLWR